MEEITKKILQDLLTPVELEAHVAADGPRGLQDLHAKEEAENNASDADGEQVSFYRGFICYRFMSVSNISPPVFLHSAYPHIDSTFMLRLANNREDNGGAHRLNLHLKCLRKSRRRFRELHGLFVGLLL
jgi:hypothetical protein